MERFIRGLALFVVVVIVGGLSGRICGFIILALGQFTGNSGSTGTEYFGYWDAGYCWWVAGWTGQPLGIVVAPIAYFIFFQPTPVLKTWAITMFGTIACGCIGAFAGPIIGAVFGLMGFCAACACLFDSQIK